MSLLVYYLGGERSILTMLHGRPYTTHMFPVSLWSKDVDVGDPYTFLFIKRGILQYVYVKPILAVITMLLKTNGSYNDGSISLTSGYFWVSFVYNLSVCLSLYCLGMFFMATQSDLEDFRYAFSHKDYMDLSVKSARMPIYYAIRDACGVQDVIQDSLETLNGTRFTYRTFEPSEGVATLGKSRSYRIMAGLRYTDGGSSKYWLPPSNRPLGAYSDSDGDAFFGQGQGQYQDQRIRSMTETSRFQSASTLFQPQPLLTQGAADQDKAPSLYFMDLEDIAKDDDIEDLYGAGKQLEYGDYNYPVIDAHDPVWRTDNISDKKQTRKRSYDSDLEAGLGGINRHVAMGRKNGRTVLASEEDRAAVFEYPAAAERESEPEEAEPREGCVDNVNGYIPERKNNRRK
ncbi:hypothetical protein BG004_000124 [Podila humilis]|nr:hypothetical protein BG004_000124 [Podila humilis]